MLKQEVYEKASNIFGVSVGIADMVGYINLDESIEGEKVVTPEEYKIVSDELDINTIICNSINVGKYQQLQLSLYELNKNRHHRSKDLTIYKKAWKQIYG
jgi:hypothetical protein